MVVDLDRDGRIDVLTSSSEHRSEVLWHRPVGAVTGPWQSVPIAPEIERAHTLATADLDGDGRLEVVVGQMHTTAERSLAVYKQPDVETGPGGARPSITSACTTALSRTSTATAAPTSSARTGQGTRLFACG